MSSKTCQMCGCNQFRADRALAGRLICIKCGRPADLAIKTINRRKYRLKSSRKIKFYFIVVVVLIVAIMLAIA